jgi:hypothetical protein
VTAITAATTAIRDGEELVLNGSEGWIELPGRGVA